MVERAEQLHRQFFRPARSANRQPVWEPPVDIAESTDGFRVVVALPGVPAEQIEAVIDRDVLVIRAVRSLPADSRNVTIHRLEIPHGHFERRIGLPPGRLELRRRELINGCLELHFRKLG